MDLGFIMLTSLRKSGGSSGLVVVPPKFLIYFVKEKTAYSQQNPTTVYLSIELAYHNQTKSLESIRGSILCKDPQIIKDKQHDLKQDPTIEKFLEFLDRKLEKYNDMMNLYMINLEFIRSFTEACIQKKVNQVPYRIRIPFQIHQQQMLHGPSSKDAQLKELELFRDYLNKLFFKEEKRKTDKTKRIKFDLMSFAHHLKSYNLDFLNDSLHKHDFLEAYTTLVNEYSDYSFKTRVQANGAASNPPQEKEKLTVYYSKFIKEYLMVLMNIE